MRLGTFALLLIGTLATPAWAAERDLCPERPGLDTPACIVDSGRLLAEVGAIDWTLDRQPDSRTDTILAGDILLRYGLGPTTEARFGWTAYGHVRLRDRTTGAVRTRSGTGDVTLGLKQSLLDPDGEKFSIALLPTVSLPVGRRPIGAGDWGASLRLPVSYALGDTLELEATPEVDAAVDEDGHGRHLAYSLTGGIGAKLSKDWTLTGELQALRDRDPAGHSSEHRAALSLAWQIGENLQFDGQAVAGLDRRTPDAELSFGVSRRF